ncbi:MAG: toll/interleukin-1 receptor domain-containing protein [Anaerolineales bacterium]|nr:toll/interleukin-1 receptor domain-containing protein [Anaerolineales bacterium]
MSLPMNRRKFHSFISSVSTNMDLVEQMKLWLTDKAGISILHDMPQFRSEDSAEDKLENALELCQSMLIPITQQGIDSGWVKREFELGLKQQAATESLFRVIPIRVEECAIPEFLRLSSYVDITENGFDLAAAAKLLLGIYSNGIASGGGKSHDVFISRPWAGDDYGLVSLVCKTVKRLGFRLIGSSVDQPSNIELMKRFVAGCGAGVAIIPNRISDKAAKKIINELEVMCSLDIPFVIVSEDSAKIPIHIADHALDILRLDANSINIEKQIYAIVLKVQEEWVNPPEYHYIFYGTDLKDDHKVRNRLLQKVVRQISAIPCLMGEDIQRGQIQNEIIDLIVHAQMMIADISKENLNTCIEAGIAIGANVPINLLSGDERHKPPFMFRDRQIWHYQDDLELLGIIHKLILPYRRYIF